MIQLPVYTHAEYWLNWFRLVKTGRADWGDKLRAKELIDMDFVDVLDKIKRSKLM